MKCPACKKALRVKNAGDMKLDVCHGGCGGIWFDQGELNRVSITSAARLHTIWQLNPGPAKLTEPRVCPRCPDQVLARKWFSDAKQVEIDQCPACGGLWLDDGEFSGIYRETKGAQVSPPGWAQAISDATAILRPEMRGA